MCIRDRTKAEQKKIFEPFYSSKNSNTSWGMGLYHVRTIVRAHVGSLRVESKPGPVSYTHLDVYKRQGFGSAARYIAQSVAEVTADVRGLPIHVVVIEASGRNAGWITAASALARQALSLIHIFGRRWRCRWARGCCC